MTVKYIIKLFVVLFPSILFGQNFGFIPSKNDIFIRVDQINEDLINEFEAYGEIMDYKITESRIYHPIYQNINSMYKPFSWIVLRTNTPINIILENNHVKYASKFIEKNGQYIGVTGLLYAEFNTDVTDEVCRAIESNHSIIIRDRVGFKSRVLVLMVEDTQEPINEIVSNLLDSYDLKYIDTENIYQIILNCSNDPLFNQQWNLDNNGFNQGTAGIDINLCDAHNITHGDENIVVAVVDEGVKRNHIDLKDNIIQGYDPESPTGNGDDPDGGHGTSCAGILGAVGNNDEGLLGIAPKTSIMPVRFNIYGSNTSFQQGAAIDSAWIHGADVISLSADLLRTNPVARAIEFGRDGLGCIFVNSSGNKNQNSVFMSRADVITVGAIDYCGYRIDQPSGNSCTSWGDGRGSNYGVGLDVVAPGDEIRTTHRNDYTNDFWGTSAAVPHVSGIAALMLAENPCLTWQEVKTIIEKTCQKLPNYTFNIEPGRPNGTWNNEVGYGLVDAHSALTLAQTLFLQNIVEITSVNHFNIGNILVGNNIDPNTAISGDYIVETNATVDLKASKSITLKPGVQILNGSIFTAQIDDFDGNCANWASNMVSPSSNGFNSIRSYSDKKKRNVHITNKLDWEVYPNPFGNYLNLDISTSISSEYYLAIYNNSS